MEHFHVAALALLALSLLGPFLQRARTAWQTATPTDAKTLVQHMGRGDNLLLLRAIAATIVIYTHSYALTPSPDDHDRLSPLFGIYSASVAVYAFFFVSGFLVTGSWLRQPSLGRFLAARAMRLVPGYGACLVICALVIGAAVTTLPLRDYFHHPVTWQFIGWNLTFPVTMIFDLPGTFETLPHHAVNGSLWTLPAEARAYALLAVFGMLGLLESTSRLLLALTVAFALVVFAGVQRPMVPLDVYVPFLGYFALGALAWSSRDWLALRGRTALGLIGVAVLCHDGPLFGHAFALALGYGCLWLAYVPRWTLGFNRLGDYSYGLYLWGFPMQQLVLHLHPGATAANVFLISWPAALGCAVLSWHLVESPALRLLRRSRPVSAPPHATQTPAG